MNQAENSELLLWLALLFGLTFMLAGLFTRLRIPGVLAALFVAMAAHYTMVGDQLLHAPFYGAFSFLAELGVLFLLFFIGLQIDFKEMRQVSGDIVLATVLNTSMPFVLTATIMLAMGYGWVLALVVGLTSMPTAEAVIVPILDEFHLIRTRVGRFIVGTGVLDDVIEVFLVAVVSLWIGKEATNGVAPVGDILFGTVIIAGLAVICYRWALPLLARWLPQRVRYLMLLTMMVLFTFGGLSEHSGLGMVVGAITAGMLLRPTFNQLGAKGEQATQAVQAMSYGLFGPVFFFWVGLSLDFQGMLNEPLLGILLFLGATSGKILGIFLMVFMGRLNVLEAWTIGIGLNARLTTELIVTKLLFDAGLIDVHVFTALVAAAALSTISVPLVFSLLVHRWGQRLRTEPGEQNHG
jgi:Ca2+-transporting ATPase